MPDKKVITAAEMRSDLKESFNQFCVSGIWVIGYFLVFPLILLGLSGGNMPYWLSCSVAGWLFVPVTGAINYLWGEHWYVGKKKWGFALVSLVVIVTSFAVHYLGQESKPMSSTNLSSGIAASTATDRTFTITLKPKEQYEVDKVRQGQQWSFPAFTGQFQSRVDTGDDSACWETVQNTLTWKAEKAGTLQIRTEQTGVMVTANVQN